MCARLHGCSRNGDQEPGPEEDGGRFRCPGPATPEPDGGQADNSLPEPTEERRGRCGGGHIPHQHGGSRLRYV